MRRAFALLLCVVAVPVAAQDVGDTGYSLPPLEDLRAVAERPLFVPGRRGAVESQGMTAAPVSAPITAALTLSGIGRRGDGQGVALLRRGSATRTLAPGQDWAGWRLVGVGNNAVDLLSPGGERYRLHIGQSLSDPASK